MRNSTAIPLSSEPNDPDPDTSSARMSGHTRARLGGWIARFWLLPVGVMLVLPVLAVLAAALQWNAESADIVREMALTVLPEYAWTSLLLCVLVAAGTLFLGLGSASLVTLFDFRGRRQWEWLLLLPLAMPAYVSAYAYTDFLQFSGPAQTWLREALQAEGRMLPEVRTVWGAAFLFIVTLYPYVYLLARTALLERATHLMEAAAMLGTGLRTRILRVALPLVLSLVLNFDSTRSIWLLFNSEFIAQEIVRTLVSSMALVLAIPVSTAIAAWAILHKQQIFATLKMSNPNKTEG